MGISVDQRLPVLRTLKYKRLFQTQGFRGSKGEENLITNWAHNKLSELTSITDIDMERAKNVRGLEGERWVIKVNLGNRTALSVHFWAKWPV